MANQTAKQATGYMVRIWAESKKRVREMVEAKTEKEGRPVSEAEIVSKAVDALHKKSRKTLGI